MKGLKIILYDEIATVLLRRMTQTNQPGKNFDTF